EWFEWTVYSPPERIHYLHGWSVYSWICAAKSPFIRLAAQIPLRHYTCSVEKLLLHPKRDRSIRDPLTAANSWTRLEAKCRQHATPLHFCRLTFTIFILIVTKVCEGSASLKRHVMASVTPPGARHFKSPNDEE